MSTIDIPVSAVLEEAVSIFKDAKALGIQVPNHVNRKFRDLLVTVYRDQLTAMNLSPDEVGAILGNRARWGLNLSKYFTLRFLKFYISRSPSTDFSPADLILQYSLPSAPDFLNLPYVSRNYAGYYVAAGPALFVDSRKYISVKLKTEYPNVDKGPEFRDLRWLTMRYTKDNRGRVDLVAFPAFDARIDPVTSKLTTEGLIKNLPGHVLNFSYGQLALIFKRLCDTALRMSVGQRLDPLHLEDTQPSLPFDLINIILHKNYVYRLAKFGTAAYRTSGKFQPEVKSAYRINGDTMYVTFVDSRNLDFDLERLPLKAFDASSFDIDKINIYEDLPSESVGVCGVLFTTDTPASRIDGSAFIWELEVPELKEYEVLDEESLLQLLE